MQDPYVEAYQEAESCDEYIELLKNELGEEYNEELAELIYNELTHKYAEIY